MNPPPPFDEGAHDRIMREARLKDVARRAGFEAGRASAAGDFEERLTQLERRLLDLEAAFRMEPTRAIVRPEGPNSG